MTYTPRIMPISVDTSLTTVLCNRIAAGDFTGHIAQETRKEIRRRAVTAHRMTIFNESYKRVIPGFLLLNSLEPHSQSKGDAVVVVLHISADIGLVAIIVVDGRECIIDALADVVDISQVAVE